LARLEADEAREGEHVGKARKVVANDENTTAHTTNITAASPGFEAAKKKENMYSKVGRQSTEWFGKMPSFE